MEEDRPAVTGIARLFEQGGPQDAGLQEAIVLIHTYEEEYGKWGLIKRGKLMGSLVVLLLAECAASEGWGGSDQVPFLLAERAR